MVMKEVIVVLVVVEFWVMFSVVLLVVVGLSRVMFRLLIVCVSVFVLELIVRLFSVVIVLLVDCVSVEVLMFELGL